MTTVSGWIAADRPVGEVFLDIGGRRLDARVVARPDVQRVKGVPVAIGFSVQVDFRRDRQRAAGEAVLVVDGTRHDVGRLDEEAIGASVAAWQEVKAAKLRVAATLLACPACREPLAIGRTGEIVCRGCGASYRRSDGGFDMLSAEDRERFRLIETENVSSHPYAPEARVLFDWARARDGLVLDVGSGDQRVAERHVICTEIVAYPATDVVSAAQRLPFRDAVFDVVHSNAVLEHVTEPFACAEEMMRVLKPGGRLFCSVPFLQAEHGYPDHYYNMTQSGLRHLFERLGAECDVVDVPDWGHPLILGHGFLSAYLSALPEAERRRMEGMTISEFLRVRRNRDEPLFRDLSPEGRRTLACANYATFLKPD